MSEIDQEVDLVCRGKFPKGDESRQSEQSCDDPPDGIEIRRNRQFRRLGWC
jgi:hypothetical protein